MTTTRHTTIRASRPTLDALVSRVRSVLVSRRLRFALTALAALAGLPSCDSPGDPDPKTGSLQLAITGLPDGVDADLTLNGPGGFSTRVPRGRTFDALLPGTYTLLAGQVVTATSTFVPGFQTHAITVGARGVSQATVIYSVTTGSIALTVTGGPPDLPWAVVITGPGGFRDSLTANRTLGNLVPGVYTMSAIEARKGLSIYAPKPANLGLAVQASVTPLAARIEYSLITGTLLLHVNGVPVGVDASIAITGPAEYSESRSGSTMLEGLRQGRYEIVAALAGTGSNTLAPSPARQSVAVIAGAIGLASVNYWPETSAGGLNLGIDAIQLQQIVQTYGGSVPVIAGRDALLRVFGRASEPNGATPAVRVRLFDGTQLFATYTVPAPVTGVPATIDEGNLTTSWNLPLPATSIRPGLRILADIDPDNVVPESSEADNSYPSSGTPLAMDVRAAPPLAVRLVPITQSATGLTGNITVTNAPRYEAAARKLLPVGVLTTEVRPPYTTNAPALQPNDANGAWVQLLSELNALRTAEGSPAHYYGVVKVAYTTGLAGISYLPSFAALGWDTLPHAADTFVHELGHHFGRLHSGSCGAGGVDAQYPYGGGSIGVYGYDVSSNTLRPPATKDIMGYCDDRWISDYTYTGIMGYRASLAAAQPLVAASEVARPGLLLWGRIGSRGPVLEPAFEVVAPARLPAVSGPHRLEVFAESGERVVALSFRGERTVDAPNGQDEHFAFVVPFDLLDGKSPSRLRLVSSGRSVERRSSASALAQLADDFAPVVAPGGRNRIRLTWTDAPGRGVLVRDQSGSILSFARGGIVEVATAARQLDLTFSDGVRSSRRTVQVR